jgi:RNA polymerase sigma factor (sigma-70 family)
METKPTTTHTMFEQNKRITDTVKQESQALKSFIRRRISDRTEVEDILQDVFYEFTRAYRLPEPIEQISAWLYRVTRNRIIDHFRKNREIALPEPEEESSVWLDEILASIKSGPEAMYERSVLFNAISDALEKLPAEQRSVFIAHELDGLSFKELSNESNVGINTLLARKRYAVQSLRKHLHTIYNEIREIQ